MLPHDQVIESLRAALAVSPDNLPLRRHLAETLMSAGKSEDAIDEFRAILKTSPHDVEALLGLASAYSNAGRVGEGLVILESLTKSAHAPGRAHVLYARLLLREGDVRGAVAQYKCGVDADPDAADPALADELGVLPPDAAGEVFEGRVRESTGGEPSRYDADIERPKCSFADVGGMTDLKEEIGMKIIYPLQHPEMYQAYGKAVGGGILMYGPPGCGKTHLARATAGEVSASFLSVGISDVLDMWIGASERNLREVFDNARGHRPCVLFFDEVDALGSRRSDMRTSGGRQLINQFLAEMDGIEQKNDGLLILAATNAPWHVDPAFRRPGRFDRVLFVPPPDAEARASILRIHLANKPTHNVDCDLLARKTDGFSGADMKAVVDQAVEAKLRAAMKSGKPQPLTTGDLAAVAKLLKPTTREWFATARNYALYSNQDGLYDDILKYIKL
ncbi:MAG: AAA family ATPase [Planctomycetales bacterium]|nr:AAA family ATPase [Planctomycetales bacterium]